MAGFRTLIGLVCAGSILGKHVAEIGHLGGIVIHRGTPGINGTASEDTEENEGLHMAKKVSIPFLALAAGACMLLYSPKGSALADVGKMTLYFGAQAGMNIYMKAVLSNSIVSAKDSLEGMPAGFACTAMQQVTAFSLFATWIGVSQHTPYPYSPKRLTSGMEVLAVCLFSLSFTMNIALNNYSISLLPISVNLVIRSCLPLSTFVSQQAAAILTGEKIKDCNALELLFMVLGMGGAVLAVWAKSQAKAASSSDDESGSFFFGVVVCIVSLFSGSVNLALAGVLGTSVHLNALDTTVYMSLPAVIILIPIIFFYSHPVLDEDWVTYIGSDQINDWQIFKVVWNLSKTTVFWAVFSGVLALGYNVLQYGVVQSLSATHTAFAGNFNKAGLIFLSFLIGLEKLPEGKWGVFMLLGVVGNIGAFTAYNFVKLKGKEPWHEELSEDEEEDSEGVHTS